MNPSGLFYIRNLEVFYLYITKDEMTMNQNPLQQQIQFITEIDKLKSVIRRSKIIGGTRYENSAEHSWHLAMMAITLQNYAESPVDISKVINMLVVHDIVEIDAGDTFAYDPKGNEDKQERERRAADRIFGLLPEVQAAQIRSLWEEFEEGKTAEARFAMAIDRLQPLLLNYYNSGSSWKENKVKYDQVLKRIRVLETATPKLWHYAVQLIEEARKRGYLIP